MVLNPPPYSIRTPKIYAASSMPCHVITLTERILEYSAYKAVHFHDAKVRGSHLILYIALAYGTHTHTYIYIRIGKGIGGTV